MKKFLLIFSLLIIPFISSAQYTLKITTKASKSNDVVYLRSTIFDDKNFIPKDTIQLNGKTKFIRNKNSIVGGIYYLYFPKTKEKVFLSLEDNDLFDINIPDSDFLKTIEITSPKNKIFLNYQRLESQFADLDSTYDTQVKYGRKFNLAQKAEFFKKKTDALVEFRTNALKSLKPVDALFIYFNTSNLLDQSVPSRRDLIKRNEFIQAFDFNTPKLLFTPVMKDVLFEYLSYYPLHSDSLQVGVDLVLNKMNCKIKAYSYVFDYFNGILKNRNIQNNVDGYKAFITKHVAKSKCDFLKKDKKDELLKTLNSASSKELQIGLLSPKISLKDTTDKEQDLHEFAKKYDYTVLVFYAPTCDHCQVEVPLMDSTIKQLQKSFKVKIGRYAICNEPGVPKTTWTDFIHKYKLTENFVHVDLPEKNEIRNTYDALSNPTFYLINRFGLLEDKKISPLTLKKFFINSTKK
jgi:thiol-disulfide isomerase/thioredoxin